MSCVPHAAVSVANRRNQVGDKVSARAWCVSDGNGSMLFGHNAHKLLPVASLTKLVTALTMHLHGIGVGGVPVSATAAAVCGTSAGLQRGETLPCPDAALAALLLPSGNDAGMAIAEASSAGFVELMHDTAAACCGAVASHGTASPAVRGGGRRLVRRACEAFRWSNPTGLDAEEGDGCHVATAAAMAAVGAACMKVPPLANTACTARYTCEVAGGRAGRRVAEWVNTHKLVKRYGLMRRQAAPQGAPVASPAASASSCDGSESDASCHPPSDSSASETTTGKQLARSDAGGEEEEGVAMGDGVRLLGGKTGTTHGAGYCLFTCLSRGGQRLCIVVLGARSPQARYTDTLRLAHQAWAALGQRGVTGSPSTASGRRRRRFPRSSRKKRSMPVRAMPFEAQSLQDAGSGTVG